MSGRVLRGGWLVNGNEGIDPASQFLGNFDLVDLPIRTNNIERMRLLATGELQLTALSDYKLLTLKGHSTQTTNIFEIQKSDATKLLEFNSSGNLGIGRSPSAKLDILGDTVDDITLRVKAAPSQTSSFVKIKNGAGKDVFTIDSQGRVIILDNKTITYGTSPMSVVKIAPDFDVDVNNAISTGIEMGGDWTFSISPSAESEMIGVDATISIIPNIVGAGTDAMKVTAIKGIAQYRSGSRIGSSDITGGFFEGGIVTDGTITQAFGMRARVLANFGGTITTGISGRFEAPKRFAPGVITTGITAQFIGGTQAGTNWNIQATNDVPSFHEGSFRIGSTSTPSEKLDVTGNIKLSGDIEIDGDLNHDGSKIGFYGKAPIAQVTAIGQLTDGTGGTVNTTVIAIPIVNGSGATTAQEDAINDNFADLIAKINALESVIGTTSGVGLSA